jgi:hypothetical protein
MKTFMYVISVAAIVLCASSGSVLAANLIQNGSFESPDVASNSYTNTVPDNWNYGGLPLSYYCFLHVDTYGLPTPIPDGTQAVSMCGWAENRFWQNTGVQFEAGKTYTLSFSLGKSAQEDAFHTQAHLMYSTDPYDWGGGYDAARVDYYDADVTLGQWNNKSIEVTIAPGSDAVGKYIVAYFNVRTAQTSYTYFDNIQLTTPTVPEPSAMLALSTGLLGLIGFAGRRRR